MGKTKFPRDIAFLGMDGIGKSSISHALHSKINASGTASEIISVTLLQNSKPGSFESVLMQDVARLSYRSLYGMATSDTDLTELLKSSQFSSLSPAALKQLRGSRINSNDVDALIATALTEFAGGLLLSRSYANKLVSSNIVAIYESWAYKHGVKALCLANMLQEAQSGRPTHPANDTLLSSMTDLYGTIKPELGVYVTGDVDLALQWRKAAGGLFGPLEDCSLIGSPGELGFVKLQTETDKIFRTAAEKWNWVTIVMQDQPIEDNLAMALEIIENAIR